MDVRLSIAIMAHPTRTQHAWWLARDLHAPIIWDRASGEWDTGARALAAYEDGATHHLVLQDDALPVAGLREHVEAAIAARPAQPISLYLGRSRPPQYQRRIGGATLAADTAGDSWIGVRGMLHGVAVVLPAADITDLLAWAHTRREPYDERIGKYYRHIGRPEVLYTWPSLVDHADGPTLIGQRADGQPRTEPRVAWRHGIADHWSTGVQEIT